MNFGHLVKAFNSFVCYGFFMSRQAKIRSTEAVISAWIREQEAKIK